MLKTAGHQIMQGLRWLRDEAVKQPLLAFLVIIFLVWLIWTILATYKADNLGFNKSLWDWMDLLIVPLGLGLGAYILTNSQQKNERGIARDRQHQATLEAYFDRMTELLLKEGLRNLEVDDEVRSIARTRTLTVLRDLDAERVGTIFRFIEDARLKEIISFTGADLMKVNWVSVDLRGARLSGANLSEADLSEAVLIFANLSEAILIRADLSGANLSGADLSEANLRGTDLSGANLRGADLSGADLSEANLRGVGLRGANLSATYLRGADLSEADLREANLGGADLSGIEQIWVELGKAYVMGGYESDIEEVWTDLSKGSLSGAKLNQATMPDGTKYEEWIKKHPGGLAELTGVMSEQEVEDDQSEEEQAKDND